MSRFAEAIETARVDVVPKIVLGARDGGTPGAPGGSTGGILDALLAMLLSERVGLDIPSAGAAPGPRAAAIRSDLQGRIDGETNGSNGR
jgi:hypothetical protein